MDIQLIAHALGVPITFFFDVPSDSESKIASDSPDEKSLFKYYSQIERPQDRQAVIQVVRMLAAKQ